MPWGRYESSFTRHPKVQQIPRDLRPAAIALHIAATLYSAELLTDGFVPEDVVPRLALEVGIPLDVTPEVTASVTPGVTQPVTANVTRDALVKVGLLDKARGGFNVHDYLVYNPSAEQVKELRKQAAERQAKRRAQQRLPLSTTVTDDVTDNVTNGVTDPVTPSRRGGARPRPDTRVPSPSLEKAKPSSRGEAQLEEPPAATAPPRPAPARPARDVAADLIRNIGPELAPGDIEAELRLALGDRYDELTPEHVAELRELHEQVVE